MDTLPHLWAGPPLAFLTMLATDFFYHREEFEKAQHDFIHGANYGSWTSLPSTTSSTVSAPSALPPVSAASSTPFYASAYLKIDATPTEFSLILVMMLLLFLMLPVFVAASIIAWKYDLSRKSIHEDAAKITATDRYQAQALGFLVSCITKPCKTITIAIHNIVAWTITPSRTREHPVKSTELSNAHRQEVSLLQLIHEVTLRDTQKAHKAEIKNLTSEHTEETSHLMHLHAQELETCEDQKLALRLWYLEQLDYTSHVHATEKDQLVEAHHLEMDLLKASHADQNRDLDSAHVGSLVQINDDHHAELIELGADHHTDLTAINETWESTVGLVSMEIYSKMEILDESHSAQDARTRREYERKLAKSELDNYNKLQETIKKLEKQVQTAKGNETFALSTVTILQEEIGKKDTDLAEAKDAAAKEITTLKEEIGKKDAALVEAKTAAAEEISSLKEELERKNTELAEAKTAAAKEIGDLKEELEKKGVGAADDNNEDGQIEGSSKKKNRRKPRNNKHDPERQRIILKDEITRLHNSPRNTWFFDDDVDVDALVAILSTFVGESAYYRDAIRNATDAVERAAGPQGEDFRYIIKHADLVRGFEAMAAERTKLDKVRGVKPLETAPEEPAQ